MILIDVFVNDGNVCCWTKEKNRDRFISVGFRPVVYFSTFNETFARKVLRDQIVTRCRMSDLSRGEIDVLKVEFASIVDFRFSFKRLERSLANVGRFYNADIPIEEMFLFQTGLFPLAKVDGLKNIDDASRYEYEIPDFKVIRVRMKDGIELNGQNVTTHEFIDTYQRIDPDIIFIAGYQKEFLEFCKENNVRLNRVGDDVFVKPKGNSYFSYGQAYYRETPTYLRGRLLLNSSSFMIDYFNLYSMLEGARICRMRIQRVSSHSVGAAVTNLLSYQAYVDGYLIPYKSGVYERIKPFSELVACDRGALTLDPKVGTHKDLAELDFFSMYPSIISKYNLSPETLGCGCCADKIPGTDYHFCKIKRGIVPKVCDYLMDRRRYFKTRKDNISESKVSYLKWLLVVIFGFQAFRNKKIGCIEVHESINACARYVLLKAIKISESQGFEVLHAIVDSLYVRKRDISEYDCIRLARKISSMTGLEIEFKKIFRTMTFLPSTNASYMPVPTAYYGVGYDGDIKVRGIELRSKNSPKVVKNLQREVIENLEKGYKACIRVLRLHIDALGTATADDLAFAIRFGKANYKVSCPQKFFLDKGLSFRPGQRIRYIIEDFGAKRYVLADDYRGRFDRIKYAMLLKKAFLRLFLSTGLKIDDIDLAVLKEKQKKITDYLMLKVVAR